MSPRDLVAFLEDGETARTRLDVAAALAERWRAHLSVVYAIGRHGGAVRRTAAGTRCFFEKLARWHGLSHDWRLLEPDCAEDPLLHARHAGLALVGPIGRLGRGRLRERVLFGSGVPTLVVPAGWSPLRLASRIVVGWNGSAEACRAIAGALPLLALAGTVHLAALADAAEAREPGVEPGAAPGAEMAAHLARHGLPVVQDRLAGSDAGLGLLEHARRVGADLLVMGAREGRGRAGPDGGRADRGDATRTILAAADLPLLLQA